MSVPRSGSTLLFETLARAPGVWTVGRESHGVFEGIAALRAENRGWESSRLTEADATPTVVEELTAGFRFWLRDRDGRRPGTDGDELVMLEKTPRNALRVPFLAAAYPDARFVYLYRPPAETIASLLEGWRDGRFVTYPDLPGWTGPPWSFLLVPGWEELVGRSLPEIAATQWARTTRILLEDLLALPPEQWMASDFQRLVDDPVTEIGRICEFLGWSYDLPLTAPLPLSTSVVSAPAADKWRRNAADIEPVLPLTADADALARSVLARLSG
jgi:hypothetical protein